MQLTAYSVRERLAHIDPSRVQEADLAAIPPMTKDDLMRHFDAILTARDVARDLTEAHLDRLTGDAYLLNHYHVVASGGSSQSFNPQRPSPGC